MMEEDKKINEASVEDIDAGEEKKGKKIKNLTSLVILLLGLLIGSIFVDVVQLVKGGGISQKILNGSDVFKLDNRTWVAYEEPIVKVKVLNDDSCEECQVDEALVWLRRIVPTISSVKVDTESEEGKKMIDELGIKSIPAFVFEKEIVDTDFYSQAQVLFAENNDQYVLNTGQIGLPAGKYVELPEINENSIKIGFDEAKVKVVEFSDFQCPYCKAFHESAKQIIEQYGEDQVQYVYKHLPLTSIHPQAVNAALASECANEQGDFLSYADKLFADQDAWGKTEGTQQFKNYAAQLGLNYSEFSQCMDEEKYMDNVNEGTKEATEFGISGTPAVFINDQFKGGAATFDSLKVMIDSELEE